MSKMNDYLIWAAEKMEKEDGYEFDEAMNYLMTNRRIPKRFNIDSYLKVCEKEA